MDTSKLQCRTVFLPENRQGIDAFFAEKAKEYYEKHKEERPDLTPHTAKLDIICALYRHGSHQPFWSSTYSRRYFADTLLDKSRCIPWRFVNLIAQYYDLPYMEILDFAERQEKAFQMLMADGINSYSIQKAEKDKLFTMLRRLPFDLDESELVKEIIDEFEGHGPWATYVSLFNYGFICGKRAERAKKKGRSDAATSRTEPNSNSNYTPT